MIGIGVGVPTAFTVMRDPDAGAVVKTSEPLTAGSVVGVVVGVLGDDPPQPDTPIAEATTNVIVRIVNPYR